MLSTKSRPQTRIHSSVDFKTKMEGRKFVKLTSVATHLRHIHKNVSIDDWVSIGVITSKSMPKQTAHGKVFSIWTISDLGEGDVTLFLFGEVFKHHWKELEGRIIALLNPHSMDGNAHPKNSSQQKKQSTAITVEKSSQILILGVSRDYGICKGTRQDGAPCSMVVNLNLGQFCEYHVMSAYKKTRAKRSDVNSR